MKYLRYVELGKEKTGSWKALADVLAADPGNMSKIKNGVRAMDEHQVLRLSLLLGCEFVEIMAAQKVERANNDQERQLWRPFVKSAAHVGRAALVAGGVLIGTIFVSPSPAEARPASFEQYSSLYYVKLRRILQAKSTDICAAYWRSLWSLRSSLGLAR